MRRISTAAIFLILLCNFVYAGIGAGISTADPSLPVELASFTAQAGDCDIILSWSTKTEVNNYGFEIQRLTEQKDVSKEEWKSIGFVDGNGNSNSVKEYTYRDKSLEPGVYSYRLKQIDTDGKYDFSSVIKVNMESLPLEFGLAQNYPNPFNPSTFISYSIPESSLVTLKVYDILGNLVTTLVEDHQSAGSYTVEFNAGDLSSGIYFYKMQSGSNVSIKKMMLIK